MPLIPPLSIIPLLTPAPSQLLPVWHSLPIRRMAELTFLGTATPFSAFLFPYQLLLGATNRRGRRWRADRRHQLETQGSPRQSPSPLHLIWEHGNTSVTGGFTAHLWQEAAPLFLERFQRWTELLGRAAVCSHYVTHEPVLSWLMHMER